MGVVLPQKVSKGCPLKSRSVILNFIRRNSGKRQDTILHNPSYSSATPTSIPYVQYNILGRRDTPPSSHAPTNVGEVGEYQEIPAREGVYHVLSEAREVGVGEGMYHVLGGSEEVGGGVTTPRRAARIPRASGGIDTGYSTLQHL